MDIRFPPTALPSQCYPAETLLAKTDLTLDQFHSSPKDLPIIPVDEVQHPPSCADLQCRACGSPGSRITNQLVPTDPIPTRRRYEQVYKLVDSDHTTQTFSSSILGGNVSHVLLQDCQNFIKMSSSGKHCLVSVAVRLNSSTPDFCLGPYIYMISKRHVGRNKAHGRIGL